MKAMLLREYKNLELTEMPTPAIGPDDVLVRVRACGICGSDVHGFDGSTGRRIPPLVMGHEAAGVVERVGERVGDLKAGDRVTFDSTVSCGACWFCRRGEINLCDNRRVLGVSCGDYRQHGAFAEFVAVPRGIVYKLPEGLPFEQAALVESVSIAVHAVNITPISLGDSAVVIGSGMIGLLVVQAAKAAGCGRVIAVDLDPRKLELAKKLGASDGIDAGSGDTAAAIRELTGGRGADVVFEVVGTTATVNTAVQAARKGGAVTLVGNLSPKIELPLQVVVTRQLTLRGSCASSGEYPQCMELMASGRIDVKPLISAVAPLDEGPRWFERLYAHEPGLMKVVLQP